MAKKGFKEYLPVLIPLIVAIVVVSTLAVSGKITSKTAESAQPTVTQDAAVEEVDDTPKDSKVTIVAVGDNLIHNTLIDSGKQQDGSLDYNSFYDEIKKYIEPADIAVIDQETVLGGKDFPYTGYPVFNSPWEIGEAAINAGFDVFTCANNHILDMGSKGIENEQKFFSKYPEIVQIGTNASEDDYNKITYYEKNGITFSLLNYTYGTNGIPLPEDKPSSVCDTPIYTSFAGSFRTASSSVHSRDISASLLFCRTATSEPSCINNVERCPELLIVLHILISIVCAACLVTFVPFDMTQAEITV